MAPDRAAFWWRVAEKFGVPCTILAFVGMGGWTLCSWCGNEIFKPIVSKHMQFLDATSETFRGIQVGQERLEKRITDGQEEGRRVIIQNQEAIRKNQETLDRMLRALPSQPVEVSE